jgi:hypothetical protein
MTTISKSIFTVGDSVLIPFRQQLYSYIGSGQASKIHVRAGRLLTSSNRPYRAHERFQHDMAGDVGKSQIDIGSYAL